MDAAPAIQEHIMQANEGSLGKIFEIGGKKYKVVGYQPPDLPPPQLFIVPSASTKVAVSGTSGALLVQELKE